MKDLVAGFTPTKSVSQYLLEDAMEVLSPELQVHMKEVVRQCTISTQSLLSASDLEHKYPGMTPQFAFAINVYTMDVRRIADVPREVTTLAGIEHMRAICPPTHALSRNNNTVVGSRTA
jgi:hypothetical protein